MIRIIRFSLFATFFFLFGHKYTIAQTVNADIVGYRLSDSFIYQGISTPHYGIQWTPDSWDGSGSSMWVSGYGGIKLFTHSQARLAINHYGNVGIGTVAPAARLNINTLAADSTMSSLKFGVPGDKGNIAVPKGTPTGGYNIDFATWRDMTPDQVGARIRAERINTYSDNNALVQGMDLAFYTSPASNQSQLAERLRIQSNGNIGIGTSSAKSKLTVNGVVQAAEIKVTDSAEDWPDYVFDSSYQISSLEQVARQIKNSGHLPDMPSAATLKQNGIDVGQLLSLQQKKIEELTLYLLAQDKQIKELQIQQQALKHQNQQLEALQERLQLLEDKPQPRVPLLKNRAL